MASIIKLPWLAMGPNIWVCYSKYFLSPGISPEDFSLRKSLSIGGFIYSVQIFTLTIKKKQTKTLFQALFLSSLSEWLAF